MPYALRPYQEDDVAFLSRLLTSANFSEQRTGKTPVALETFRRQGLKKFLVVCPASALYQWKGEVEFWLGVPCIALTGTPAQRAKLIQQWTDGLIVSYGTLKSTKTSDGELDNILARTPEGVILDEAHRIKNPQSAQCKAAFRLIGIRHRMALTGTPAPNRAHEVWSILHFLYPKEYPSYWRFIEDNFGWFTQMAGGHSYREILPLKRERTRPLQEALSSISVCRKRRDVMEWLPDKDYERIYLPPTTEQTKYLNELLEMFETEHIITQGVLDRLIRYRQICLAPELLGLKGHSPKMEWLDQCMTDYPDRPTIVFSKFTSFLKLVEKKYDDRIGLIIGETPIRRREELRLAFQSGRLKYLFVNIDAGKEALTLDTAECVVFTDKYPPVGDIAQAEDRFVATTKDKASKGHLIIELVMKGTYDEDLYDLIAQRKSETEVINDFRDRLKRRP